MLLSDWADKYAKLSVETSEAPGDWETFGPQREPMDAMTDIKIRRVVMRKGVRIGFTKALVWLVGYHTHWDPASILFFQPTDSDAQDFSESEILPMIRDVKEIRELSNVVFDGGKAKEQWHTRKFKNGAIMRLRGAAADGNFRRLTTRINIADEIDDQNWADKTGDKLTRLRKRGTTFWNSKLILGGSPVLPAAEGGRTDAEFQDSDQRHFYITCPHCAHEQEMIFGEKDGPGIAWNEDMSEVYYRCAGEDACKIQEQDRLPMLEAGRWIPHNPGHPDRGYHYPQFLSQFVTLQEVAHEWRRALKGGMSKIQVFKNEVLGEPFLAEVGESVSSDELLEFVVDYGGEVPDWVEVLTAGVDVQKGNADGTKSYMEAGIWGFGKNGRKCLIGHFIMDEYPLTDPQNRGFDDLEALLLQSFTRADGRPMRVEAVCIDSHGGFSQKVYSWVERMRRKGRKRWFAVRGSNNAPGTRKETIWPKASAKKVPVLFTIDVNLAKDDIAPTLAGGLVEFPSQTIPGSELVNEAFMRRLTREKQIPVEGRAGVRWTTPSDQEPWDCLVYAYAATHALRSLTGGQRWKRALGNDVIFRGAPTALTAPTPEDEYDPETGEVYEDASEAVVEAPKNAVAIKVPQNPMAQAGRPPVTPGRVRLRRF
jgi:phage terminase large subunit GpA-like protein